MIYFKISAHTSGFCVLVLPSSALPGAPFIIMPGQSDKYVSAAEREYKYNSGIEKALALPLLPPRYVLPGIKITYLK